MDHEAAKFWFDVIQTALIAVIGIMNWLNNRQRVTNATIATLEGHIDERQDDHNQRLTRVEQDIKHAPKTSDLAKIYERLNAVDGGFNQMKGEIHGISTTLNLIHHYLLDKK